MITLEVTLYAEPTYSPLTLELLSLGVIKDRSEAQPVLTIIAIKKGTYFAESLGFIKRLDESQIEQLKVWAEQKYGEECEVQIETK